MISSTPVLVRIDSGNDSADNIKVFDKKQVDFIIKRNPRKESLEQWLYIAKETGNKTEPRLGKTVYTGVCTMTMVLVNNSTVKSKPTWI